MKYQTPSYLVKDLFKADENKNEEIKYLIIKELIKSMEDFNKKILVKDLFKANKNKNEEIKYLIINKLIKLMEGFNKKYPENENPILLKESLIVINNKNIEDSKY